MILPCLDRQQGLALWALMRSLCEKFAPLGVSFSVQVDHQARLSPDSPPHPPIRILMDIGQLEHDLVVGNQKSNAEVVDGIVQIAVTQAIIGGYVVDTITGDQQRRTATLTWRAR